ncbi:alpha/beta fold hydrolase, partial [Streptomyces sp. NPDC002324]
MSSSNRRTRISRRTAMLLAGVSVVAAVAATAPSMANAVSSSSSSSGMRQTVTQTRSTESASTAPNLRVKAVNGVTYQYRRF